MEKDPVFLLVGDIACMRERQERGVEWYFCVRSGFLPIVRTWFLECECEPEEGWRFLGSNWIAVSPGIDVVARSVCSEVSDRSEWSRSSVYGQFLLVVEEDWVVVRLFCISSWASYITQLNINYYSSLAILQLLSFNAGRALTNFTIPPF